ncbi:hypothetical protein HYQ45_004483 [Verticillium longisporum]|uniref:Uncharacterized protein n=1 Tax=Verticillium longisporum TaxID=100787 RepID=A0A8I2ZWC0_VERLO|nr:hypothetical protein HYQ45_004483 [Verticillium longisporum]
MSDNHHRFLLNAASATYGLVLRGCSLEWAMLRFTEQLWTALFSGRTLQVVCDPTLRAAAPNRAGQVTAPQLSAVMGNLDFFSPGRAKGAQTVPLP